MITLSVPKMLNSVVYLFASLVLVYGQGTQVQQCTVNGGELPLYTEVVGCVTPPCQLPQLEHATINIVFRTPKTMRSMRTLATAWLLGIGIGINHDLEEDAHTCNFLVNTYCPVMKDEVVQYQLSMLIEDRFPQGVPVTIEFRITDEQTGDPFVCIRLPIRVTAPLLKRDIPLRNGTVTQ